MRHDDAVGAYIDRVLNGRDVSLRNTHENRQASSLGQRHAKMQRFTVERAMLQVNHDHVKRRQRKRLVSRRYRQPRKHSELWSMASPTRFEL